MADAAVEFMLENLKQLLLHYSHLITDAKGQVEKLEIDLRFFKGFLKDSTKRRRKDEAMRQIVRDIRGVVYEAEDIIDAFVTQAIENKYKNYFARAFLTAPKLLDIAQQVETVCKKIKDIRGARDNFDIATLAMGDGDGDSEEPLVPVVREENVVGFEDAAEEIKGYLREETHELDVISIIGMPGLGKTTLAGKIYRDPDILYEFPTRIWVYVSQEFTNKDVFLAILRQIMTNLNEDIYGKKSVTDLAKEIASNLKGKFLIVMDDVWAAEDWDKLRIAMPKTGKVLLTSRNVEVANSANRIRPPHRLRFLTQEESWLLLRLEVFRKPECPPELDFLGQQIALQCDGLPLAVVVIGGILARKFLPSSDGMAATKNAWRKVSESVSTYLKEEDPQRRMEKIISLSYEKLPYHLRECFLYLGMFPEDYEIPAWKLIRMWIAEGLVQQKDSISLEQTAENYLEELINRNLVRIDKRKADGKVKTCRIHDMLREFCRTEAGEERENFLQEIKTLTTGGFHPQTSNIHNYRRLCIHSNVLGFLSSKDLFGPHVRSFICFYKDEFNLPNESIYAIPAAFKLLRVLDAKPIKFTKLPSNLYHLVHLRYITLSFNSESSSKPALLPAAFSKLWNLQTFVVYTTSRFLDVKADILNMIQLRHFKTNASAILAKPSKKIKEGERLQTLDTVSPKSCTEEVFDRARNLKKLGIRGKLALLMESKNNESFDSLRKLDNLEKLKLLNDVFPSPRSEGRLRGLPPTYKFPTKLRSLTLFDTSLDWTHMSVLGLLENLEVLKLKDNAFEGKTWQVDDNVVFRRLEVLQIGRTDLAIWEASGGHFPKLQHLQLQNCEKLQQVPIGLADVPGFRQLDLYRTKHAAASARKIHELKRKQKPTGFIGEFKLAIFPRDD